MAQFRMDIALMCKLFIEAPSSLWVSKSRSIRIQKQVTSIKLESYYWTVLEEIATRDSLTIPLMVNRLYSESIEAGHDLGKFHLISKSLCGTLSRITSNWRYTLRHKYFNRIT